MFIQLVVELNGVLYIRNMGKGILILLVTFIVVGIIHYISMRTMKLSETKKTHYRKLFWYFYGIILMLSGGVNLVEKGEFIWIFSIEFLLGFIMIILNFMGKIETKTN